RAAGDRQSRIALRRSYLPPAGEAAYGGVRVRRVCPAASCLRLEGEDVFGEPRQLVVPRPDATRGPEHELRQTGVDVPADAVPDAGGAHGQQILGCSFRA